MLEDTITMPQHRSPFDGHRPGTFPTASGQVGVRLRAATVPGLLQVSTWPTGLGDLRAALAIALGLRLDAMPVQCGHAVPTPAGSLLMTGPEEFQLLVDTPGPSRAEELRRHIAADVGSVVDLGHARCRIGIEGPHCRDTLSKLFALDLREATWPMGALRLTGHHHVPCLAMRLAVDVFDLLVFTTYAFDQLGTLMDAAQEYGVALELATVL